MTSSRRRPSTSRCSRTTPNNGEGSTRDDGDGMSGNNGEGSTRDDGDGMRRNNGETQHDTGETWDDAGVTPWNGTALQT
ncbi:hypothetical protein GCM10011579_090570 [Streptomyces albiflavescens]|uniref:Uncharacterized protein n=1 Tax=Streptomyces albiflavescens TaxID=1623582 RepID=A0A918D9T9_9ACTN|nr:hypothetical protein GCM10011579_090570 [Streptomyces albiflavescens]